MRYVVKLTNDERARLAALKGCDVRKVIDGGWDVQVITDQGGVVFIPEEIATPDAEHPLADVVRPSLVEESASVDPVRGTVVGSNLGTVQAVFIYTSLVNFSQMRDVPQTQILGVTIPAGQAFGPIFRLPPHSEALHESEQSGAARRRGGLADSQSRRLRLLNGQRVLYARNRRRTRRCGVGR